MRWKARQRCRACGGRLSDLDMPHDLWCDFCQTWEQKHDADASGAGLRVPLSAFLLPPGLPPPASQHAGTGRADEPPGSRLPKATPTRPSGAEDACSKPASAWRGISGALVVLVLVVAFDVGLILYLAARVAGAFK